MAVVFFALNCNGMMMMVVVMMMMMMMNGDDGDDGMVLAVAGSCAVINSQLQAIFAVFLICSSAAAARKHGTCGELGASPYLYLLH